MEDKDKIITTLRKQLKEVVGRCNALEQENALLSYQLERKGAGDVLYHTKDR